MFTCPVNNDAWKTLVKAIGEDHAYSVFYRNGNETPSVEKAKELLQEYSEETLRYNESINPIVADNIVAKLARNGSIDPKPADTHFLRNGKWEETPIYKINDREDIGEKLAEISEDYGAVAEYVRDDRYQEGERFLRINGEIVSLWNEAALLDHTKHLKHGQLLTRFLNRVGIDVASHDDLIKRFGAHGIADIGQRLIILQRDPSVIRDPLSDPLTEEVMHFFVEMLPANNPDLVTLMDEIRNHDIYKEVLKQYENNKNYKNADGTVNYTKIKKEAIGKALADVVIGKADTSTKLSNLIREFFQKLMNYLKGIRVKPTALDKLADAFMQESWSNLNRNIESTEVYNKMSAPEKSFYEAQEANEEQKKTIGKILSLNEKFSFDEAEHKHSYINPLTGETVAVPSSTQVIGSDFTGDLDNPDTVQLIHEAFAGVYKDEPNGKAIAEKMIEDLIGGHLVMEEVEKRDPKLVEVFNRLVSNKQKTLFGSALHNFLKEVILKNNPNPDDVYNPAKDSTVDTATAKERALLRKFVPKEVFHKMLYGDSSKGGLIDYIRREREAGSVIMTEVQIGNDKLAGIVDLMIIKKDGTVEIHDYKTKYLKPYDPASKNVKENLLDELEVVINLQSSSPVKNRKHVLVEAAGRRRTLQEKWSQQLTLYKKMLMNHGVSVGDLAIIAVPYRINVETGKVTESEIKILKKSIKYIDTFGVSVFPNLEEKYDTNSQVAEVLREDVRVKDLEKLDRDKMKESFNRSYALFHQMYTYYSKNKDVKNIYKIFSEDGGNRLGALRSLADTTLADFEKMHDFLSIQHNFLHMLDDMQDMINVVSKEFEKARNTLALDQAAFAEQLAMLNQLHELVKGFDRVLDGLTTDIGTQNPDNLIVKQIEAIRGQISNVSVWYNDAIIPVLVRELRDQYSDNGIANIKREYDELIASEVARGNEKKAEELRQKKANTISEGKILSSLLGKEGDVHWFYGELMAAISIPDVVLGGLARRLKTSVNNIRLVNKNLQDEFSTELNSRKAAYGNPVNLKSFNEPLTYTTTKFDMKNGGDGRKEIWIKTEFDEKLYYDHDKLIYTLNKAVESKDATAIRTARKALSDFERKYMVPNRTEAYYKATEILDQTVQYEGEIKSIREIQKDIYDQINNILGKYNDQRITEGDITAEDLKAMELLHRKLKQLKSRYNEDGSVKTGDAKKIYDILQEHFTLSRAMYDHIELKGLFERERRKVADVYGEGSREYQDWYSKNTRKVITEEYWDKFFGLLEEIKKESKRPESQQLLDLYKQRKEISNPYRDEDGVIQGDKMPAELQEKAKGIDEEIKRVQRWLNDAVLLQSGLTQDEVDTLSEQRMYKETGDPRYSSKTVATIMSRKVENERLKDLQKQLGAMSRVEYSEYYNETLNAKKQEFADAQKIDVSEIDNNIEYRRMFERTDDWFQANHTSTLQQDKSDDPLLEGEFYESYEPIYIWKRSVPIEIEGTKYVKEVPAPKYFKRVLKESYTDADGNEVQLINKDNKDITNRIKPKSAADYKREFGVDHPYLNKEYVTLRDKYNSGTASTKEKADYENLIFIEKKMIETQEKLPYHQRLGMSVPFIEKKMYDRVLEDGVKDTGRHIKRKFAKTEDDINEGFAKKPGHGKLATIDNNEVREIPVLFTTKGEIVDASYDIWGGILRYVGSANQKEEFEKVLPIAVALESVMSDPRNQPRSENMNLVLTKALQKHFPGMEEKIIQKGNNMRLKVARSLISSTIYNEELFEGFDIMGMDSQKIISNAMGIISRNTFAFGVFNWATNWLSGSIQSLIESGGGKVYTVGDMTAAKKDLWGAGKYGAPVKDLASDIGKLGNLSMWGQYLQVYDFMQGEFENEFGKKTSWSNFRNIFSSVSVCGRHMGEWELQASSFIAFMKNHRLYEGEFVDKDTFITKKLGDTTGWRAEYINGRRQVALEEFNKLTVNLLDAHEMKDGKLSIKDEYKEYYEIGSKPFNNLVAKMHALHKKLNGSYAKFDKTMAEKTSLGRLAFFFRKHVIPLGMNRFGKLRENMESESLEEGFYRTFFNTLIGDLKNMRFNIIKNWSTYSPHEKRAMKKTLTEIGVILSMFLVYAVLFGFDSDDEERFNKLKEQSYFAQSMVFLSMKLKSETEQFIPWGGMGLSEIERTYKNPSLVLNQISSYIHLAELTTRHIAGFAGANTDDLYYKKDVDEGFMKDKGDSKLVAEAARTLLGFTGKTFHPVDMVRGFESMQKRP